MERASGISQMTVAPEMRNALELIERGSKAGIVMSAGHTEAREEHMRLALEAGLLKVTHLYNAMTFAEKRGLFRLAGLAEYALIEERLSCEIIADGVHVEPVLLKLAYQSKGAARLALISDALAGTGLPVGSQFMLGTLRATSGRALLFACGRFGASGKCDPHDGSGANHGGVRGHSSPRGDTDGHAYASKTSRT